MKANIVVIENQQFQYEHIYEQLTKTGSHRVFPEPDRYHEFINWVLIFLDNRYADDRQKEVKSRMQAFLKEVSDTVAPEKIDLFMIDFKLTGNWEGSDGTVLAIELQTGMGFPDTPIIFFSQTPEHDIDVNKGLAKVQYYTWVEKGYAGAAIQDPSYFQNRVLNEIPTLITKSARQQRAALVKELRDDSLFNDHRDFLSRLHEKATTREGLSPKEIELIDALAEIMEKNKKGEPPQLFIITDLIKRYQS